MSDKDPTYCRTCTRVINRWRNPYCHACRPYIPDVTGEKYEHGLRDGEWVLDPVRRIQVWRKAA